MFNANFSRVLFLLSLTLVLCSSATADPVSVVGTATPTFPNCSIGCGYTVNLTNLSSSISMNIQALGGLHVNPLGGIAGPGQRFFLDFSASGMDAVGSLTVDGVTYPAFAGLIIRANPVFGPLTPPGAVGDSFSFSSFVFFTGAVFACDNPSPLFCTPLFRIDLIGSGRIDVTARIGVNIGQPTYTVTSATYTLTTPEPSSLILFASGLVGFAGFVRRMTKGVRHR